MTIIKSLYALVIDEKVTDVTDATVVYVAIGVMALGMIKLSHTG
jgi:hypothetical protein